MIDLIKYDYDAILSGLSDINSRLGVLDAQGGDIRSEQAKIAGYWEDEKSAAAYQQVQSRWNEAFGDITELLGKVRVAAETAVTSMRETNDRAASGWGG
ncbi:WXG100 family type VII secretion target [Tsukamurella soli]|uniref:ESAT-6-like protein n=1 Tax=Tsukamurella soli TaxID=644556 RepID=A0ABP8KK43_9ACTN